MTKREKKKEKIERKLHSFVPFNTLILHDGVGHEIMNSDYENFDLIVMHLS